jgi:phage regulator Rha-like protein
MIVINKLFTGTVTSKEIADAIGVKHRVIMTDIRRAIKSLKDSGYIDSCYYCKDVYINKKGKPSLVFRIDVAIFLEVVKEWDVTLRFMAIRNLSANWKSK